MPRSEDDVIRLKQAFLALAFLLTAPCFAQLVPPVNGIYMIINGYSKMALDDPAFSQANGQLMSQWPVNSGTNQNWQLVNLLNGSVELINRASGKVLETANNSLGSWTLGLIDQNPYVGTSTQQWKLVDVGGGFYKIVNGHSGQAMQTMTPLAGAQVAQAPYAGTSWQKWVFQHLLAGLVFLSTDPLPVGDQNVAYSFVFTGQGGKYPYSYTATGVPAGLKLSAGGVLSGATMAGDFTLVVSETDSAP